MCWKCTIASLGYDPAEVPEPPEEVAAAIERGGDLISAYMREHDVGFPEAIEALANQRQTQYRVAFDHVRERHGLGEDDAVSYLLTHGVDGPGALQ